MTEQKVAEVPTAPASPAATVEQPLGTALALGLVTLAWAAGMLLSARDAIITSDAADVEVIRTAYSLPGVISAVLVASACAALTVLTLLGRRRTLGSTTRFAVAIGSGLVVGVLGALLLISIDRQLSLFEIVGGAIAASGIIGGALGGIRIPRVIAATSWAAVAVFVADFLLNLFESPLLKILGAGSSNQSQTQAAQLFSYGSSLVSGLIAGLLAYAVMRRARRRSNDTPWPFYALAGGGPGLFILLAEAITRTAGYRVLDLAGRVSAIDLQAQKLLNSYRLNNALIVFFVGAIAATIAVGRTIKPAEPS